MFNNGRKGEPRSFDRLEALLPDQAYRLSCWRVADDEINFRRFFDVNLLAAIRVEDPAVFEAVHSLPRRLAREMLPKRRAGPGSSGTAMGAPPGGEIPLDGATEERLRALGYLH